MENNRFTFGFLFILLFPFILRLVEGLAGGAATRFDANNNVGEGDFREFLIFLHGTRSLCVMGTFFDFYS